MDGQPGSPETELRVLELRHRIKNILAVVQSLVHQTLRDDVPLAEARETLSTRLSAISHAVDLLLSNSWQPTDLSDLIQSAMTLGAERLRLDGPELRVGPTSAMMLSILFHEFECNAVKYGALSADGGLVQVSWTLRDGALLLEWQEQGGPRVEAPARQGFGSQLVSKITARIDGTAATQFSPDGLRWTLSAPMETLST